MDINDTVKQYSIIIDEITEKTRASVELAESLVSIKNEIENSPEPCEWQMSMVLNAVEVVKESLYATAAFNKDMDNVLLRLNTLKVIAIAAKETDEPNSIKAAYVAGEFVEEAIERAKLSAQTAGKISERLAGIIDAINEMN
jgi:hypothetical protein